MLLNQKQGRLGEGCLILAKKCEKRLSLGAPFTMQVLEGARACRVPIVPHGSYLIARTSFG